MRLLKKNKESFLCVNTDHPKILSEKKEDAEQ